MQYHARQFVIAGIPNQMSSTPALRRLGWAAIIVASIVLYLGWLPMSRYGWWVPVALGVAIAGGMVIMHRTGTRERHGTERFVLTPDGIARTAIKPDPDTGDIGSLLIPWGQSDSVHVKKISVYWKRLRIGRRRGKGLAELIFDAGIRCPDHLTAEVVQAIRSFMLAPPADEGGRSHAALQAAEPPPAPAGEHP